MKGMGAAVGKSLLWCFIMLLFPIASGTLSAVLSFDAIETLLLQGLFMLMAMIPPVAFVLRGTWHWRDIGFARFNAEHCKKVLYFFPLLVIYVPAAVKGFTVKSPGYVLGNLFLYLSVGISEEVYFRGIVPNYLKKEFTAGGVVLLSTLIFGVGHIAAALSGMDTFEIVLTVLNALIFGWLTMEMTMISSNIVPAIFVHFLFDFETKVAAMSGRELLTVECLRGMFMLILAVWLTVFTNRRRKKELF